MEYVKHFYIRVIAQEHNIASCHINYIELSLVQLKIVKMETNVIIHILNHKIHLIVICYILNHILCLITLIVYFVKTRYPNTSDSNANTLFAASHVLS